MFRSFITLATLLTTGAHALVGCCWHHDHGAQRVTCEEEGPTGQSKSAESPTCGCRHAGESHSHQNVGVVTTSSPMACGCGGHSHDNQNPCDPCDEGQCHYLLNAKVEPPSWNDPSQLVCLVMFTVATNREPLYLEGDRGTLGSANSLFQSVRDVTQIALI